MVGEVWKWIRRVVNCGSYVVAGWVGGVVTVLRLKEAF